MGRVANGVFSEESENGPGDPGRRARFVYGRNIKAVSDYTHPAAPGAHRRGEPGFLSGLVKKFDLRDDLLVRNPALGVVPFKFEFELEFGRSLFPLGPSKMCLLRRRQLAAILPEQGP